MSDQYNPDDFCSSSEAAKRLGVSPKTVQLWVENGTLRAWKTAGGHRRITMESVMALVHQRQAVVNLGNGANDIQEGPKTLLVVEDDANLRRLYEFNVASWKMPLKLETAQDGFEALIKIGELKPDILITDLRMPSMDGFEMLRRLGQMGNLSTMLVIAVSAMDESEVLSTGQLPEGVPLLSKPVPFAHLKQLVAHRLQAATAKP